MLPRNTARASSKPVRTKLDAAIVASLLAMGTLNLLVLADQLAPAKAYAATPCRCVTAGFTLA